MSKESKLKQLKAGHHALVEIIHDLNSTSRDYDQSKSRLRELEVMLLNYFGRQSSEILVPLEQEHSGSREKLKLLEFFQEDLKDIKVKILTFFEEYSGEPGKKGRNFMVTYQAFSRDILARIAIEEQYLYPFLE